MLSKTMKNITILLADISIAVAIIYDETAKRFKDYLTDKTPLYYLEMSTERVNEELMLLRQEHPWYKYTELDAEFNAIYRDLTEIFMKNDAFIFHALMLGLNNDGYVFTAPSGIGKSTHGKLWEEVFTNQVQIINGDKPILRIVNNCLYGYGSPWQGKENIKDYSLENLRENIAIVLQKNYLFSGTLKDNLLWGNKQASDEELFQAMKDACVDEFFPRLQGGLNYELGVNGGNVSGGQKQRICIARALLKKPKILILDDSTSALDNNTEKRLMKNLSSMRHMTTIIITQRLNSLILADRVMVLSDGQISGFDTKEKLLESNEIFKEFYKSQMKVQENG